MESDGVRMYLLAIDPESLLVTWANDNVEAVVRKRYGETAVGKHLDDVIQFAESLDLPGKIRAAAESGEAQHLRVFGFSPSGGGTRTDGSIYRLPKGDLLIASEFTET